MLGNEPLEKLQNFRGFQGVQSYPSRTKDVIPVDFSTGSVGLGVAVTAFASLVQDYLIAHGRLSEAEAGRMIALTPLVVATMTERPCSMARKRAMASCW